MGSYGNVGAATTGLAGTGIVLDIAGHAVGVLWMVAIAVLMVALGALCLRLGWRRGKPLNGR